MVTVDMCPQCRRSKRKCTPSHRIWVEGGEKQKCDRCSISGRQCGPNERRLRPPRRIPLQQHAQSPPTPGPSVVVPTQREPNTASVAESLDFSGDDIGGGEDRQELRRRLVIIDNQVETLKRIQGVIESLEIKAMQREPHYDSMISLKGAITRELALELALAEALADRMSVAGEIEAVECAYTRILEVYGMWQIKARREAHQLLLKMARFYRKRDPLRAENLMWETLIQGLPRGAQESDLNVLKKIAKCLPRTSKDLSSVVQDLTVESPILSHLNSPFPPLQRMMESKYASNVSGNIFQTGCLSNLTQPVIGGIDAIREFLCVVPADDFQTRDLLGRSPLFLAADLQKEHLGLALLQHLTNISAISCKQFTNTRDIFGQTVLGIAIFRGCSLEFIEYLIDYGAEVDPETLMERIWTPLQLASYLGNSAIVDLLLKHDAKLGRVYPGSRTPEALAQEAKHEDIVRKLQDANMAG